MQAEAGGKRPPPLSLPLPLPPLGEVASHGAACGIRWRRLPRLTEAQLREQLLRLEEGERGEGGEGKGEGRRGAAGAGGAGGRKEAVPLHARLDGRLVATCPPLPSPPGPSSSFPSSAAAPAAARLDRAHAAVIDDFLSEEARAELLSLVVFGGGTDSGKDGGGGEGSGGRRRQSYDELSGSEGLPRPRWERRTADSAETAADPETEGEEGGGGGQEARRRRRLGWGLSSGAIADLLALASAPCSSPSSPPPLPAPPRALAEVGSKLSAMFPEHDCLWLPTESMEGSGRRRRERESDDGKERGGGGEGEGGRGGDDDDGDDDDHDGDDGGDFPSPTSPPLLANAASPLDAFSYHVDCDPDSTPEGTPWHAAFGHYANGSPDRPLLVSVVLYLNEAWNPSLAGETLVADSTAGVGCCVLPRPRRALLLESDVLHKVCPPGAEGGGRLRFSLVLKLALCPRRRARTSFSASAPPSSSENVNVLSREWWGPPADLGSAKALSELVRRVGEEKRKEKRGRRGEGEEEGGG